MAALRQVPAEIRRRIVPLLLASTALAIACGGDQSSSPNTSSITPPITPRPLTGSRYPHEPPDYNVIAENGFRVKPRYPATASGVSGLWWQLGSGEPNDSVVQTGLTPQSPPWVMQTRFPAGLQSGSAPTAYGGWDRGEGGTQLTKMYVSVWIRMLGTDFENQIVGTKIAFIGFGRDASTALNDGCLFIPGDGVQGVHSSFNLDFREQNNVARVLAQNRDTSKVFTIGQWHHFELALELNTLGAADGRLRWWVDNQLILDYSDVVYILPGATGGFQGFKIDPVWGGLGGVRTRDDFMQVDHIYISGLP